MELNESMEEVLEILWIYTCEENRQGVALNDLPEVLKGTIPQLLEGGYISRTDGQLSLTAQGEETGQWVVRRHRLAERLLSDVLSSPESGMHEKACRFEHLLDRDLDESICTLLGHPNVCPHGKPIPPGKCCQKKDWRTRSVVFPLTQLKPQQPAKIAYIHAPQSGQLQKLMSMGILPGTPIRLIQSFPSYVFELRRTQFAVDKDIANTIYVRLVEGKETPDVTERVVTHRFRWGRKR